MAGKKEGSDQGTYKTPTTIQHNPQPKQSHNRRNQCIVQLSMPTKHNGSLPSRQVGIGDNKRGRRTLQDRRQDLVHWRNNRNINHSKRRKKGTNCLSEQRHTRQSCNNRMAYHGSMGDTQQAHILKHKQTRVSKQHKPKITPHNTESQLNVVIVTPAVDLVS